MADDVIIGAEKEVTLEERLAGYNEENAVLLAKYKLQLGAEPFIDLATGVVRARPTAVPLEMLNKDVESK